MRQSTKPQVVQAIDPVWDRMRREAEEIARKEPVLGGFIFSAVLNHSTFERALVHRLAQRLGSVDLSAELVVQAFEDAMEDGGLNLFQQIRNALNLVIHGPRRLLAAGKADDLGWNTCNRAVWRHIVKHDRAGGNARAMANFNVAKNLGACADQHAMPDLRMAVATFLARSAKGNTLQDGNIVLDHRGFADHDIVAMIDHDALADFRRGVDVNARNHRRAALQVLRKVRAAHVQEPVRHAVGLQRLKALEIEQRVHIAVAGGIALEGGNNVSPRRKADFRLFVHGIFKSLHHQFGA